MNESGSCSFFILSLFGIVFYISPIEGVFPPEAYAPIRCLALKSLISRLSRFFWRFVLLLDENAISLRSFQEPTVENI
ncbi:hypothetical protein DPV73_08565 [Leptospira mayottensis]|nr:hypothetical protein DPV73_08565 [Leptospira mayottensis]